MRSHMGSPAKNIVDSIVNRFRDAQAKLVFQTSDLPLGTLAEMVQAGTIDLEPSFQRRERWHKDKQSALIESFVLNVPVPPIYLSEDEYGKYTAIDGKQRLRTICDYMYNRFKLQNLEGFRQLEGRKFSELPKDIENALRIRPFLRVVILLKQSDPNLKYEVFTRLNRGGEALNAQELRNVAFRGPLNTLIYKLSENKFLRSRLKIVNSQSSAFKEMAGCRARSPLSCVTGSTRRLFGQSSREHGPLHDFELELLKSQSSAYINPLLKLL